MNPKRIKFSDLDVKSSRLMKAPYPVRLRDCGLLDGAVAQLTETFAAAKQDFLAYADSRASSGHYLEQMLIHFAPHIVNQFGGPDSPRVAMLTAILGHAGGGIPVFEATPALIEMLELTDLGDEIAVDQMQLPVPRTVYLRLATDDPKYQQSDGSNMYPLDGVLLRESEAGDGDDHKRMWDIAVVSSLLPTSKDIFDDAVFVRPLDLFDRDAGTPLVDVVRDYDLQRVALGQERVGLPGSSLAFEQTQFKNVLSLVAKVLLYINLPGARRIERPERTLLRGQKLPKSPGKQAKLMRRLVGYYDRIEVGPTWEDAGFSSERDASTRRAHMRRGHFRNQRVGVGRTEQRLTWIRPTVVGAHSGDRPLAKDYLVTAPADKVGE